MIVFGHPVDGWDAAKYIDTLYDAFKARDLQGHGETLVALRNDYVRQR